MARKPRPTGDQATNARKRFYRSAERYLKQAAKAVGATAAKYRRLAQEELENAISTYSKKTTQKFSKPIQRLANELGVDLEREREKIKKRSDESAEKVRKEAIDLGAKSKSARSLAKREITIDELREEEARKLLNNDVIGSRILGGLVEVWRDEATVTRKFVDEYGNEYEKDVVDKSKILPALFEFFEVDNLSDLIDRVEDIVGESLYANYDSDTIYESVKIMLQTHVQEMEGIE